MPCDLIQRLKRGTLYRTGLYDDKTLELLAETLKEISQSTIETVRVLFADQHGILRGKTIVKQALESVVANGMNVPGTLLLKDTSHRTVFPVWTDTESAISGLLRGASDVTLVPDIATYRRLPWSQQSAWILCDAVMKDATPIDFAARTVLKKAVQQLLEQQLQLKVGLEVEFHVFETTDTCLEHADTGMPGRAPRTRPLAQGYQFLTETRYADLEPVMDQLRRHCQALQLPVRSMEVEMGPSQFEFTFDPADPLTHADNMVMFRTMVKEVCAKQGMHASFMCRPKLDNIASNGWHLHQSLLNAATGENLMEPESGDSLSVHGARWIAGLLKHASESCLLTTPTVNGYKRYQPYQLAPDRIQWGVDNRGALIRSLCVHGEPASRIENRVAETAANPYYCFASQIISGLSGVTNAMQPPESSDKPYQQEAPSLPATLAEAIESFAKSDLYRTTLGDDFVDYLVTIKSAEWNRYRMTVSDWEQSEYFSLF